MTEVNVNLFLETPQREGIKKEGNFVRENYSRLDRSRPFEREGRSRPLKREGKIVREGER